MMCDFRVEDADELCVYFTLKSAPERKFYVRQRPTDGAFYFMEKYATIDPYEETVDAAIEFAHKVCGGRKGDGKVTMVITMGMS